MSDNFEIPSTKYQIRQFAIGLHNFIAKNNNVSRLYVTGKDDMQYRGSRYVFSKQKIDGAYEITVNDIGKIGEGQLGMNICDFIYITESLFYPEKHGYNSRYEYIGDPEQRWNRENQWFSNEC